MTAPVLVSSVEEVNTETPKSEFRTNELPAAPTYNATTMQEATDRAFVQESSNPEQDAKPEQIPNHNSEVTALQNGETETPLDTSTGLPLRPSYRTPKTASDPPELRVLHHFVEKTGNILANGWVLGKKLGSGVQGTVYLLEDKDGKDAGRVFKQVNVRAVARVSGALIGIEREWAIGRELNLLNEDDGFLEGFMQTGSKVLKPDGSFLGVVLEKLNGKDVKDRLDDTGFNDIDYIMTMVMQVLGALDRALLRIGFQHRDTNAHNVMEHWLDEERAGPVHDTPPKFKETELGKKLNLRGLHFKLIDYGHSYTNKNDAIDHQTWRKASQVKEPKVPCYSTEHFYRRVFHGRSDVWRFMLSLGRALEGRVWEQKDERKVRLLMETIHYTTGYSHNVYFASAPGQHKQGLFRRPMSVGGPLYGLKWVRIMSRAYCCPSHPLTTPREALDFIEEERIRVGLSEEDIP
ncbi:Protein kinase-like superfamily protein [Klebsormidium nitens]|uniref:Protein kinase-like superfamily protein n=1 Tax=Klebsormidium nitens TaxID=105231 RepID=A0A1Y1IEF1_KLENI|nr:Protein kinase-like superfamily protein [Klebsormidium nitens]|eukprot:GAQ89324.1 Protein kinase-like superfamily protein [Klebsormidium nitens]